MTEYFNNIISSLKSFATGLKLTMQHFNNKKDLVATLQYPNEKWPLPERKIGFEFSDYNSIRTKLHVDIDDCIGCLKCERACPVDCIKIETVKPPKGSDYDCGITSNDTKKKMLVVRHSIDMSECMYCNLCTFPCPEDCIYMVGGPNQHKKDIDYEYTKYNRNELITDFTTISDEEIKKAGGEAYLAKRNWIDEQRKAGLPIDNYPEPEKKIVKKAKIDPLQNISKPDFSVINLIEDRVVRSIAKKAFIASFKSKLNAKETADAVRVALVDAEKYTDDLENIINQIKEMNIEPIASVDKTPKVNVDEVTVKSFNDLSDKMVRGLSKKAFLAGKKLHSEIPKILEHVQNTLLESDMLTEEVSSLLEKLNASIASSITKENSNVVEPLFDIKKLNEIEDKMVRGTAKKTYISGKKSGLTSKEILTNIRTTLEKSSNLDSNTEELLKSIESECK